MYLFKNQIILTEIPDSFQFLLNIFQIINPQTFWAFYNSESSTIKEIDKIKAQFKNAEGILDIDKLGTYLKTKPKALEKYCDY